MEKMKLKIDYSVYLVTDTGFLQGRDFAACIEAALKGGVTLLQYRDKNADSRVLLERALLLKKMCAVYHVPLLINDRLISRWLFRQTVCTWGKAICRLL